MDPLYKKNEAATRLAELAEDQISRQYSDRDFIATVAAQPWPVRLCIDKVGDPASFRLISRKTGEPDEEIVFILHGILAKKDLPPIEKALGKNTKAGYMSQQVVLTGLGASVFDNAMEGIKAVEKQFRRNFDDDELETHSIFGTSEGFSTIQLSNRYVTSVHAANGLPTIVLGPDIDPKGHLARAMGDKYVRTDENVVQFFELAEQGSSYETTSAKRIKKGDIVEAQFSLSCVSLGPKRNNRWRMMGVLRSLTMLDRTYSEDAVDARGAQRQNESQLGNASGRAGAGDGANIKQLRRRVGHGV
ncbi:hypothetical protein V5O48_004948 [Marasmius crinis-equi]|uniref:Uncharacterized protein n=1 Tax=Marasmius crinis-equi TaxID=585013 RepID=A0ABR3FNQ1_9AGAR